MADRWNAFRAVFAAGGVMGQGTNLTTGDLPFSDAGLKTFARFGRLSGNTATGGLNFTYNMESQDCYCFVGKTVTLSFYYRTGANFSGTSLGGRIYTGTGPDEAVRNGLTGSTFVVATYNPNTSWQRGSLTYTIGTNINQICLSFGYTPVGTAGAADHFDITGVQLELGSVATPFEVRPYPVELQLCMRYTYVMTNTSTSAGALRFGAGHAVSSTDANIRIQHLVQLRAIPTVSTTGSLFLSDANTGHTVTSSILQSITSGKDATQLIVSISPATSLVQYRPYYFEVTGGVNGQSLILSAEL